MTVFSRSSGMATAGTTVAVQTFAEVPMRYSNAIIFASIAGILVTSGGCAHKAEMKAETVPPAASAPVQPAPPPAAPEPAAPAPAKVATMPATAAIHFGYDDAILSPDGENELK